MTGLNTWISRGWNKHVGMREYIITFFIIVLYLVTSIGSKIAMNEIGLPFLGFFPPVVAIPVPFGLLFGWPVAVGAFVGNILVSIVNSTFGVETVFLALSHGYLAYSAYKLRGYLGSIPFDNLSPSSPVKRVRGFVVICVIASGGAAAIVAWGHEIGSVAPFFQMSIITFISYLLVNLTLGFFIFVLLMSSMTHMDRLHDAVEDASNSQNTIRLKGVVTVLWITFGFIGSVGYRTFEKLPRRAFTPNFEFLLFLDQPDLFGPGATRIHVSFGAVMFSLLLLAYRWESD